MHAACPVAIPFTRAGIPLTLAAVETEHVRALMADADARGDVVDSALLL